MEKDRLHLQMEQDQLHRFLQESIACYQKLMDVYGHLKKKLSSGGHPKTLQALVDQSRELYTVVQFVDKQFQELALEKQLPLEDTPLYSEWKRLMDKVRKENKLIRQQLQGTMAILKDDIYHINHSKKIISGYRNPKDYRGKRINFYSA